MPRRWRSARKHLGRAWSKTGQGGETTLTLYQPQVDSWDGFSLGARLAVQAAVGKTSRRLVYGIVTIRAQTLTDKGRRVVTLAEPSVLKAEFPSASAGDANAWGAAIAQHFDRERTIALEGCATRNTEAGPSQRRHDVVVL